MLKSVIALGVGGLGTAVALRLIAGHYVYEGPRVLSLSRSHGIHEGDLVVLGGWAFSMVFLLLVLALWPRRRRD